MYDVIITGNSVPGIGSVGGRGAVSITAKMPESYDISIQSDFDAPYSQSADSILGAGSHAASKALGGTLDLTQKLGPISISSQAASAQIWQGASPIDISIPLEFYAEDDARSDVVDKVRLLKKLSLPSKTPGTLGWAPPGPRVFASISSFTNALKAAAGSIGALQSIDGNISIAIGPFLRFPSVVIVSVTTQFNTMFGTDGSPMVAKSDVAFRTFLTPTAEDVDAMMGG